jgi:hypothetical protein
MRLPSAKVGSRCRPDARYATFKLALVVRQILLQDSVQATPLLRWQRALNPIHGAHEHRNALIEKLSLAQEKLTPRQLDGGELGALVSNDREKLILGEEDTAFALAPTLQDVGEISHSKCADNLRYGYEELKPLIHLLAFMGGWWAYGWQIRHLSPICISSIRAVPSLPQAYNARPFIDQGFLGRIAAQSYRQISRERHSMSRRLGLPAVNRSLAPTGSRWHTWAIPGRKETLWTAWISTQFGLDFSATLHSEAAKHIGAEFSLPMGTESHWSFAARHR